MNDRDGNIYFLTDQVFRLKGDKWERQDLQVEGKISMFCPVASADYWFSVDQVTNTSILYHHDKGVTKNISSPVSNHITSLFVSSSQSGCLSSYSDVVVFHNNAFNKLRPAPVRFVIEKLFTTDFDSIWGLTNNGEFFLYHKGRYERMLAHQQVKDFEFLQSTIGYVVANDEIFEVTQDGMHLQYKDSLIDSFNCILPLREGELLLAGKQGKIATLNGNRLTMLPPVCHEDLSELIMTPSGEIWVGGEKGVLLYCGNRSFPPYSEQGIGFTSWKLIKYGISTDDEYGVVMEDFDRNGTPDIYAVRIYEQNRLYMNYLTQLTSMKDHTGFVEEAFKRNATGSMQPGLGAVENELKLGVAAADVDVDGDQDIYICYLNSHNRLLLNEGNGYFRNVAKQKGRACHFLERSNSAAFADIDLDGDPDLFVTSEEGANRLFENDGTGHFTDITIGSGLISNGGGMCASFADLNEDGLPDLVVSSWYFPNRLYLNTTVNGKISFSDFTPYTDLAKAGPAKSNAIAFADVNNDGHTDLFIANRDCENKLYLGNGMGELFDRTDGYFEPENYLTNGAVFADFDLDGFDDLYITNVGANVLYHNIGGKYFKDVTTEFGAELSGYCTGCAAGDIDLDGDPDLYVANYINGDSKFFQNNSENCSFVKFQLKGVRSCSDAIGAKVWLFDRAMNDTNYKLAGYKEIRAGSGYASCSLKEILFGVKPKHTYRALVKFPSLSDTIKFDDIQPGNTYFVREERGVRSFLTVNFRRIVRFFSDAEMQPEILKYLIVVGLLVVYNLRRHPKNRTIALITIFGSTIVLLAFVLVNQQYLFYWPGVRFFIGPIAFIIFLETLHLFIGKILIRNLASKEKLELRGKISRDLHDDLASTLGSISIYAGTMKGLHEPDWDAQQRLVAKIAALSEAALQSISDLIWMTSPRHDSLQSLITKTLSNLHEMLSDNNIRLNTHIALPDKPVELPDEMRNNIFLILKEALHNIIRHAAARNVTFTVQIQEHQCSIQLKDDGIGLPEQPETTTRHVGNGLINMRKRAEESKIQLTINSAINQGTEIVLFFNL